MKWLVNFLQIKQKAHLYTALGECLKAGQTVGKFKYLQ